MNEQEKTEIEEIFKLCENSISSGRPSFETIGIIESMSAHLLGYEYIIASEPKTKNTWRK